ncbi:uncharacterized protein LOC119310332 [Triticum dicoccoides]|uniref:uncharacterized protein LOC119310332 n=1 Tax=Triticum dicoccoides TaxID=85692 RepID=UPI001890E16F|nr:uncharacterized protein LOC119310332 [Triticum dicoccoides]
MEYSTKLVVLLVALMSAMAVTAQNSEQDFVDAHNAARADVGLGEVTWDATVAAFAQDYADQRRGDCQLIHTPDGRPYGENLYGGGGTEWTATDAVNSWVSEKQYYDHDSNTWYHRSDNPYAEKRSTIDFWRGLTDLEGDDVVGAALAWESKEEELRLPPPTKKRLEPPAAASPLLQIEVALDRSSSTCHGDEEKKVMMLILDKEALVQLL